MSTTSDAVRGFLRLARQLVSGTSYGKLDKSAAHELADNINAMLWAEPTQLAFEPGGSPLYDRVRAVDDDGVFDGTSAAWDACLRESGVIAASRMFGIYESYLNEGDKDFEADYYTEIFRLITEGIDPKPILEMDTDGFSERGLASLKELRKRVKELFEPAGNVWRVTTTLYIKPLVGEMSDVGSKRVYVERADSEDKAIEQATAKHFQQWGPDEWNQPYKRTWEAERIGEQDMNEQRVARELVRLARELTALDKFEAGDFVQYKKTPVSRAGMLFRVQKAFDRDEYLLELPTGGLMREYGFKLEPATRGVAQRYIDWAKESVGIATAKRRRKDLEKWTKGLETAQEWIRRI